MKSFSLTILANYLRSRVARDFLLVFLAQGGAALAIFFTMVLLSRSLGPSSFGTFSVLFALMSIVIGVTDFGIGTGLVQFSAPLFERDPARAARLLKALFFLKALIGVGVLLIGIASAPMISTLLFRTDDQAELVVLTLAVAGVTSLGAFFPAYFQAKQRFFAFGAWLFLPNLARLLIALFLFWNQTLTMSLLLASFLGIAVASVAITLPLTKSAYLRTGLAGAWPDLLALFHFSKWVMLSFLVTAFLSRVDLLMLPRFVSSDSIGIYSAAVQLIGGFQLITLSLGAVLLPWVSRLHEQQLIPAARLLTVTGTMIALSLAPILFFSHWFVGFFFGAQYLEASNVFRVLGANYLIAMVAVPLSLFLYRRQRPDILFGINLAQLVIVIALNIWAIPRYGIIGPAYSYLAASIIGAALLFVFIRQALREEA